MSNLDPPDQEALQLALLTAIGALTDRMTHYQMLLSEPDLFSVADPGPLRTTLAQDEASLPVLRWMSAHPTRGTG